MKRQDKQQWRGLTLPQLRQKLVEAETAVVESRLKVAGGQEKNIRLTETHRQQIAVIKTLIREKELRGVKP